MGDVSKIDQRGRNTAPVPERFIECQRGPAIRFGGVDSSRRERRDPECIVRARQAEAIACDRKRGNELRPERQHAPVVAGGVRDENRTVEHAAAARQIQQAGGGQDAIAPA